MTVLFRCMGPYQLFIAALITEIYYKDENTILLVDNETITQNFHKDKQIINSKIWNEVIELQIGGTAISEAEKTIQEIISEKRVNVYHFFTWGDSISCFILNHLPNFTKAILTEEGSLTYTPLSEYIGFKNYYGNNRSFIDINRFNEIWLLEPLLYDHSLNITVHKINFQKIFENEMIKRAFLNKVNILFHFDNNLPTIDIVFFDGYYSASNTMPLGIEKAFLNSLIDIISEYEYIVKLHPSEKKYYSELRYEGKNPTVFSNNFIPWELIQINLNQKRKITLISIASTSIFNSLILSDISQVDISVIILDKLVGEYINEYGRNPDVTAMVQQFRSLKPRIKIYQPKTMEEFKKNVYTIYKNPNILNKKASIDNEWFKQEYKRLASFFGNTVTSSSIILSNDKIIVNKKIFLDFSMELQKVMFNLMEDNIIGNVEVLWKPYENEISDKIIINELIIVDSLQNKINIPLNSINLRNDIDNDGYISLDKKNPYIIFDLFVANGVNKIIIDFTANIGNSKYDNLVHYKQLNEKAQDYYRILLKWLDIKQLNIDIKSYFEKNKYRNIGIYGNGELGLRFYKEIKGYSQNTFYISSESSYLSDEKKEACVYNVNDFKKIECDIVIITPVFAYHSIVQKLIKIGFSKEIVSIEDVFNDLLSIKEQR